MNALGFIYLRKLINFDEVHDHLPSLDWDSLEDITGLGFDQASRAEIEYWFKLEFYWRLTPDERKHEAWSNFQARIDQIEGKAKDLQREIDNLAEVSASLLMPPKSEGWLVGKRDAEDSLQSLIHRWIEPSDDDFFDYLAFRKQLDYFTKIGEYIHRFEDYYGGLYQTSEDRDWLDLFIRRTLLALIPTNADLSVTIPTDTNLDYRSPIVVFYLELLKVFEEHSYSDERFADLHVSFSYRQVARKVLELRNEFESSEIIWALLQCKQYDREQSE